MDPTAPSNPVPAVDEDEMKKAYKAIKKRVKLTQLEEDSKLGGGHLSRQSARITAIQPPLGYVKGVWEALADKGLLKNEGRGFYSVVPGRNF